MIKRNLYNSSGKIIGYIEVYEDKIKIYNNKKPLLIIEEEDIVNIANGLAPNDVFFDKLYNEYTLCICEIAAILDWHYHMANKKLKELFGDLNKAGRRNSSWGIKFDKQRIENMVKNHKTYYHKLMYEMTPEIKAKISRGVKAAYARGDLDGKKNAKAGWANGRFDNVDFGRGIAGHFTSKKMNKTFFFRSLLELDYMLYLEIDDDIIEYEYEPFRILCDNGSYYTPDFLVNNIDVIELKSYKYIHKVGGEVLKKFQYKCQQGQKYCDEHGLNFNVIYDKDVGFETKKFIHLYRDNPMVFDYIGEYNITFTQPERFFGRKK